MNSGLAWLLQEYWAARGHVYDHPTLHEATGLVEPTGYACIPENNLNNYFEIESLVAHQPDHASSATDPALISYTVKWKQYEELTNVKLAEMQCEEAVSDYWATKPRVQKVPVQPP